MKGGLREHGIQKSGSPERPLISIITVVWNGEAYLERTINSVLGQEYDNVEYIVVDGASEDGTLDIIKQYEDKIDLWVSEPDKGIYDAMNKGIGLCTGDLIGMINADDHYVEGVFSKIAETAVRHPEKNIFHGDIYIEYGNGHLKTKKARKPGFLLKYWEMVLNHPSFFVRRELYMDDLYDTELRVNSDHKWTLGSYLKDPDQFQYISGPLAYFSAGGASMTIPLSQVIKEGNKVSKDLGMTWFERAIGTIVKLGLYIPQYFKLQFNQFISPKLKGTEKW